jgi:hypothetical protein
MLATQWNSLNIRSGAKNNEIIKLRDRIHSPEVHRSADDKETQCEVLKGQKEGTDDLLDEPHNEDNKK